jgi:hypothetical protein
MDKLDDDEGAAPLLAAGAGGAAADGARPTKLYSPFACFAFTVNVRARVQPVRRLLPPCPWGQLT